jgi:glycosyltransferase involved in cell wall biosynthesis
VDGFFKLEAMEKHEMTESKVKVSFVMGTYNRPESLCDCLASLENQTVSPHEVIIVVDGGFDIRVQEVIDTFREEQSLNIVQLVNEGRKGSQISRERGTRAATGDVIAYLDDDVTLEPEWLAQIIKAYEDNPDAVGVGGLQIETRPFMTRLPYRIFYKIRQFLVGVKMGRFNFIGMPNPLEKYDRGYLSVEFLNGGSMTYRSDVIKSRSFAAILRMADDIQIGYTLTRIEGNKLIYNSEAVAYHHRAVDGGLAMRGSDRLQVAFKDNTMFLLAYFNMKYIRLTALCLFVFMLSLFMLRPNYLVAVRDGIRQYNQSCSEKIEVEAISKCG